LFFHLFLPASIIQHIIPIGNQAIEKNNNDTGNQLLMPHSVNILELITASITITNVFVGFPFLLKNIHRTLALR